MKDILVVAAVSASFALALTALVTTAAGLFFRRPRWRAAVVLVCPVLAPWWAIREGMYVRAAAFLIGIVGYIVALAASVLLG